MDILGYRGNAIKVHYSNEAEKEAIIVEVLDKGAYVMSNLSDINSFLYIIGEPQKIAYHLVELNYQTVDFEDLSIDFPGGEDIEDISLIEVCN